MSDVENGTNNEGVKISEKTKKPLEQQVNKILKELTVLGDLGIKHRGEIPEEVVEVIFETVKKKLATVKKQFKNNDDTDEFKL
jgi:hypothetical protein